VFASTDPANATERLVVMAETRERDEAAREALRRKINETAFDAIGMPADEIVLAPPHSVLKTSSGKIRRAASREAFERGEVGRLRRRPGCSWPGWPLAAVSRRPTFCARRLAGLGCMPPGAGRYSRCSACRWRSCWPCCAGPPPAAVWRMRRGAAVPGCSPPCRCGRRAWRICRALRTCC
jgi:hypothetical protein